MNKILLKKYLYIFLGTICFILAWIGIVMPGIPGTPFVLLTGYFYFNSSDKLYAWILKQRIFAKLIGEYNKNPQIPLRLKIFVLIPFWVSIAVAEFIFMHTMFESILLIFAAVLVSVFVFLIKK
jgi:uncharacterized protein